MKRPVMTGISALVLLTTAGTTIAQENRDTPSVDNTIATNPFQGLRDPFWPVGFTPEPETEKEDEKAAEPDVIQAVWPSLKLRGITRTADGHNIAILESIGLVEPGDIVTLEHDGLRFRWRINAINDNGISRTRLDIRKSNAN